MKSKTQINKATYCIFVALVICFISGFFIPHASAADATVNTKQELQAAINEAGSTPTTIYVANNISLSGTVVTIPSVAKITIQSNMDATDPPYTITQTSGRHFNVSGSLTLENVILDGGSTPSSTSTSGGVLVAVDSGSLTINDGAVIQNCYYSASGSGVLNNGTFTMNGGTIRGNTASSAAGGVYVADSASFTMNGGIITSNTAKGSNNAGSGVHARGVFYMYGGEISGNIATGVSSGGSGVCVFNNGTFHMGRPSGNGGEPPIIRNNSSVLMGGGVYVQNGTFYMNHGIITGNSTTNGGGIYVTSGSTLNVTGTGGTPYITDNHVSSNGGGVYTANTTYANLTTAGNTVFNGNTASSLRTPPTNAASAYPNIGFASVSVPGVNHPLNNFDVNHTDGAIINRYRITVLTEGGGTASASESVAFPGTEILLKAEPEPGYRFKEWQVVSGGVTINDNSFLMPWNDVTVLAVFEEIPQLLVTFDSNGGSPVPGQTVPFGGTVARPDDPTKEGFVFAGWFTDNQTFERAWDFNTDTVTRDTTLYAKWVAEQASVFTVTFDSNGGSPVPSQTVPYGWRVTRPDDPFKEGYAFDGWFLDDDAFERAWDFESDFVTGNMTLYSKWKKVEYGFQPETG